MRRLASLLALPLALACGDKVDHPSAAPACDPAVTDCDYTPPMGGGVDVGNQGDGGDSGTGNSTTTWTGQILSYTDDDFEQGITYEGKAEVSATGVAGARVKGSYDGTSFTLKDVLKSSSNWFLVEPEEGAGVLPTISPVDTRVTKANGLGLGLVREADIDGIFTLSLAATERSSSRAQLVIHVVDDQDRSVAGVEAALTAEVTAYRDAGTWNSTEGAVTDDTGLIFLGNVPATSSLAVTNIVFRGSVSARVEARIKAGATTVLTAVVSPP
jgi:hypothetical protein